MEVTKKHRALAGVLGLALLALITDRLLPGPAGAEAALLPDQTLPEGKASALPEVPERPRLSEFADALEAAAQSRSKASQGADAVPTDDAFSWGRWASLPPDTATDDADLAADFAASHSLTSLIVGGSVAAVVDGELVALGAELDGFRLVGVSRRSAHFARAGVRVSLTLPDDP